jgi:hypothetical protein
VLNNKPNKKPAKIIPTKTEKKLIERNCFEIYFSTNSKELSFSGEATRKTKAYLGG